MGAETFTIRASGKSAADAFHNARQSAQYEHGHGGYSGTIAEKSEFVIIPLPAEFSDDPEAYAEQLIDRQDRRIDDKWGPAGALRLADRGTDQRWLFFGWASS